MGAFQPLAEMRAATSDLLTMLSNGALTPPAIVRYSFQDFQEAVHLADGEAGQQRSCLTSPISEINVIILYTVRLTQSRKR